MCFPARGLVGGLGGMAFAVLLGYVTTKKSGTTFAMITLGLGELVFAMSLMVPEFFGGEGGVSANRVVGKPVLGISYGPQIQVYYLLAVYTLICTALMYAFTRTPLFAHSIASDLVAAFSAPLVSEASTAGTLLIG